MRLDLAFRGRRRVSIASAFALRGETLMLAAKLRSWWIDLNPKSPRMQTPWRMVCRFAAWTSLAAVAAVTVGPISYRPLTSLPVNLERLLAWVCVGALFAIAYVDRVVLLLLLLIGAAGLLELGQLEVLQRHAAWADFFVKAAGALVGIGSVRAVQLLYLQK